MGVDRSLASADGPRCGWRRCALAAFVVFQIGCGAPATLVGVRRGEIVDKDVRTLRPDELQVVRPGVGPLALERSLHLREGDEVSTGPSTEVLLRFEDSAFVLLRPNTRVTIKCVLLHGPRDPSRRPPPRPGPSDVGAKPVSYGEVVVKARARYRTHTEWVDAEVEGTQYALRVTADGEAVLKVFKGTVALESRTGAWTKIHVHEGEEASALGPAPPSKAPLLPEDMATLRDAFEAFDRLLALGAFGGG